MRRIIGLPSYLSPVALSVCALLSVKHSWAEDYFDPNLLAGGQQVDLSAFANPGGALPGTYLVDIYLNNDYVDSRNVTFVNDKHSKALYPELTIKQLAAMGVNTASIDKFKPLNQSQPFGDISAYIPSAKATLNMAKLRLDISVPQIAMNSQAVGIANPKLWDEGINAFLLNYSLTGQNSWNDNQATGWQRQDSLFTNVNGGLNVGAWRLRGGGSYSLSRGGNNNQKISQWNRNDVYLQRDVPTLHSELTLGEVSSGGGVFDSVPLRGAILATNDSMTPDNQRGFAPIISGVANSNAQITIRQNGNIIYQTYVAAGPFRITDLTGNNNQGDLQVTIKEADGTQRSFSQPYSSLPIMQREGHLQYELAGGKYRNNGNTQGSRSPLFMQGTGMYGLPHNISVYGGLLVSKDYQSTVAGVGTSLGDWGALSADATVAVARLPGQQSHQMGESYRVKYSKSMLSSGTTMDLTAYRYSTSHYYSFSDVNSMGYQLNDNTVPWAIDRRRSSWQMNLSQTLGRLGSIYFNGSRDDYWGNHRVNNRLSAGYNTSIKSVGIGINYSIDHVQGDGSWPENRSLNLSLSLPLSFFGSNAQFAPSATYSYSESNQGQNSNSVSLSGQVNDRMNYNLSQNWGNQGQGSGGGLGLSYRGDISNSSINYNYSRGQRSVNYSVGGGLLLSGQGAAFSPTLGNGAVLVRTPGAGGVTVLNGNTSTNGLGYAVIGAGSSYRKNTISIDPTTLPDDVDIKQTSVNVYPTQGAVVVANYKVKTGQQLLMNLKYQDKPVPFGATASLVGDDDQDDAGIVGDAGQVYLTGMPQQGTLKVQWGPQATQQCLVHFTLNAPKLNTSTFSTMQQVSGVCQ